MTTWEALEIVLVTGKKTRVVVECVIGPFAIHHKVWGGLPQGDGWAVTHRETGLCVWSVFTEEDARKVAHWLDDRGIIPTEKDAMLTWRSGLSSADKTKLIGELSVVAKRHVTAGHISAVFGANPAQYE